MVISAILKDPVTGMLECRERKQQGILSDIEKYTFERFLTQGTYHASNFDILKTIIGLVQHISLVW
jgi:hypothetical protein